MDLKDLQKKKKFLIPPHPLTNFEIQNFYQNEPRFNGLNSRNNLLYEKGVYIIKIDEFIVVGNHWTALYALNNDIIFFNSFGVDHISKEIRRLISDKKYANKCF